MQVTHNYISAVADAASSSIVKPQSGWNAVHNISMMAGYLLGNASSNSGTAVTISTGSPGTINLTAQPYAAGAPVYFSAGSGPSGLTLATILFVVNPLTNSFQVAAQPNGTPLNITTAGSAVLAFSAVNAQELTSGTLQGAFTWAGAQAISNTTPSTSASTGALTVAGGVGVTGDIFGGATVNAATSLIASSASNGITITQSAITRNNSAGSLTIAAGSGTGTTMAFTTNATPRMSISDTNVNITSTTGSSSVLTGALTVVGGVGIGSNVYIGGAFAFGGNVTSYAHIQNNTSGTLPTDRIATNNGMSIGWNQSGGSGEVNLVSHYSGQTGFWFQYYDGSTLATMMKVELPGVIIPTTAASTSTTTGALTVGGGVGIAGAIFAGGSITSSVSNGIAFAMSNSSGIRDVTNGSSVFYMDVSTGGATNGSFAWRSSNSFTALMTLSVATLAISPTTASTSPTTGALVVGGGLGVAGALWVGGLANVAGALTVGGVTVFTGAATITASSFPEFAYFASGNTSGIRRWQSYVDTSGNWVLGATDDGNTNASNALVIGRSSYIVTSILVSPTTASSSTTTGALIVGGGVGIAGAAFIGLTASVGTLSTSYSFNVGSPVANAGVAGFTGVSDTTGYVNTTFSGGASGYGAYLHFTDGAVYNLGIGTDGSGNFTINSGLFAGSAGTQRLKLTQAGVMTLSALATGALTSVSGVITSSSDARMKTRVSDFTRSLIDLRKIGPATNYEWNGTNDLHGPGTGWMLSAGEGMVTAIPEAVNVGKDGMYGFNDRPVLAACVNAVIEVDDKVASLTAELAAAKSRIASLEDQTTHH